MSNWKDGRWGRDFGLRGASSKADARGSGVDGVRRKRFVRQTFVNVFWQAADKIVYSRTLETVSSAKTRIERDFDPEAVRQMKARAARDITVGGPDLAAQAPFSCPPGA
jgi:hypothetical protein